VVQQCPNGRPLIWELAFALTAVVFTAHWAHIFLKSDRSQWTLSSPIWSQYAGFFFLLWPVSIVLTGLQFMLVMGNDNVNTIYEANMTEEDVKPNPKSDRATREKFIIAKYKEKKYLLQPKSTKRVQREFIGQLTGDAECDLMRVSKYLAQGTCSSSSNINLSSIRLCMRLFNK